MPIPLGILAAAGFRPTAGSSYELIETITVGSGGAASVTFSNLNTYSTTYQHLQIRAVGRPDNSQVTPLIRFNGDTTFSNYRTHFLEGNGSSVSSGSNQGSDRQGIQIPRMYIDNQSAPANQFGAMVIDILDPYETSKNTVVRAIGGFANGSIEFRSGVWLNTAAISSITLSKYNESGGYAQFSRFSIYGLKAS